MLGAATGANSLAGFTAIVTGGSRGLGAGIARALAAAGAQVGLLARDAVRGEQVASDIRSQGGAALYVHADISLEDDVASAVRKVSERFGALHLLVNNAGLTPSSVGGSGGSAADISLELWNRYLAVNVTGTLLVSRHAVPHMRAAGYGSIVNINSPFADYPPPGDVGYVTSKAALTGLTKSMAVDFGPSVRVNQVMPGFVPNAENPRHQAKLADPATRQTMLDTTLVNRIGTPGDIASACVFLCGRESGFITGQSWMIDGGAHTKARSMSGVTKLYERVDGKPG